MSHITEQDRLTTLADAVVQREKEVFGYQINIDNYTAMIAATPEATLPANLEQYLDKKSHELPATLTEEEAQLVSEVNYIRQVKSALRTEKIEQNKSQKTLDAIKSQIPAAQYDALIADAVLRTQAAPAA